MRSPESAIATDRRSSWNWESGLEKDKHPRSIGPASAPSKSWRGWRSASSYSPCIPIHRASTPSIRSGGLVLGCQVGVSTRVRHPCFSRRPPINLWAGMVCREILQQGKLVLHETPAHLRSSVVTKTCTSCKQEKALVLFNRHRKSRDGRDYVCKACGAKACKAYRSSLSPKKTNFGGTPDLSNSWYTRSVRGTGLRSPE